MNPNFSYASTKNSLCCGWKKKANDKNVNGKTLLSIYIYNVNNHLSVLLLSRWLCGCKLDGPFSSSVHLLCVHFYLGCNELTCGMINDSRQNAQEKHTGQNDNRMTLTLLHLSLFNALILSLFDSSTSDASFATDDSELCLKSIMCFV